jgi:PAS domain S-box-containing protein
MGLSAAAVVLALLLHRALEQLLGQMLPPYILLYPTITLVAIAWGFWAGILATLLSALAAGAVVGPLGEAPVSVVSQVIFLCAGYSMSVFADIYRSALRRAENYERELAVRESQAELQQSRERLRVTLSSIADAVISCDAAGRIVFMNPKAEELTGWSADAATGASIREVLCAVDEETRKPAENIASRVLRERRAVLRADHLALLDRRGGVVPIEDSGAPILGDDGELTGVVVVFRNVTEQRRAQEQTRASERRYRTLVEMSPDGVVVQLGGKIVYANAVAVRLFGAKYREQLQGRNVLELIHPAAHEAVRKRIATVENGGVAPLREVRIVQLDGSIITTEATAAGIDWQGQTAVQSILRDITDRKAAEAIYIQTEKLATVGRMAASIAHEINNPLAAVMNTLYLARKTPLMPPAAMEYLEIAEEELKRVSHITRQVLGFYREGTTLKWVQMDSIMDSAVDLLQSKIRSKRAQVEKIYRGNLEIKACSGELRQVFSNLLANSLESMDEGGVVKIHITGGHQTPHGERTVRVTLADSGPGILPEVRPRIFEALFTTKNDTGTGLGLWVSRQIVEKHGGSIRFRSRSTGEKTGTVFTILLPAERGQATAA